MTGRPPNATPAQIAAMLHAGATYLQIKEALHVSSSAILAARKAHQVPLTPRAIRELPPQRQRELIEARYPLIAAMLRDGATVAQIKAAGHGSNAKIYKVRNILQLPGDRRARTIPEALAQHVKPHGDGHARWTGPTSRADGSGQPQLWAHNRRHTPRREIFRAHHGRDPQGPVTATCTQPRCMAGDHLADDLIRQAAQQLDDQYTAIFGPDAP
ncbi:hypothetical protein [Streptomyces sp. NPDC020951]|uniref:hypothetical protein n=1 Tax=Streptomyces sp. NPDC020951 TaxID=3365104 RepID=UPI003795F364